MSSQHCVGQLLSFLQRVTLDHGSAGWLDLALSRALSRGGGGGDPRVCFRIQPPGLPSPCQPGPRAPAIPAAAAVERCSADNDFAGLANGLRSAFEAFCSQLQVATSGKQRNAPTVAAAGFAVKSLNTDKARIQSVESCVRLSFCSVEFRGLTFVCLCGHISKAATCKHRSTPEWKLYP